MIDRFFSLWADLFSVFEADEFGYFILGFCMLGIGFSVFSWLVWGARGGRMR